MPLAWANTVASITQIKTFEASHVTPRKATATFWEIPSAMLNLPLIRQVPLWKWNEKKWKKKKLKWKWMLKNIWSYNITQISLIHRIPI